MRIGINTRSLLGQKMEGFGNYTLEIVKRLTIAHPEHTFICYFDRPVDPQFSFGPNVIYKSVFPPTRHPFLYIIWFQWRLKRAILKDQLDVFWSPDGMFPLGLKTPVLATIHDLNFEHYPKDLPRLVSWYYRKYFPRFAQQASHLISVSQTTKEDIMATYSIADSKISVIYNGVNTSYQPLDAAAKNRIREKHGLSKPYFLFVGSLHPRKNIHRLITAFEAFAQADHTFELVIVGSTMWKGTALQLSPTIADRVQLKGHISTEILAQIMATASAFVYVPYFEGFGMPLAEAMAAQTPIIAGDQSCLPEIAGPAALYVNPFDPGSITAAMHQLKNDVALQTQLVEAGQLRVKAFDWDQASKQVWQALQNLVS